MPFFSIAVDACTFAEEDEGIDLLASCALFAAADPRKQDEAEGDGRRNRADQAVRPVLAGPREQLLSLFERRERRRRRRRR